MGEGFWEESRARAGACRGRTAAERAGVRARVRSRGSGGVDRQGPPLGGSDSALQSRSCTDHANRDSFGSRPQSQDRWEGDEMLPLIGKGSAESHCRCGPVIPEARWLSRGRRAGPIPRRLCSSSAPAAGVRPTGQVQRGDVRVGGYPGGPRVLAFRRMFWASECAVGGCERPLPSLHTSGDGGLGP